MSELYRNGNFCVAAGSFLNLEESAPDQLILSISDADGKTTHASFRKTNRAFSNYNKLQRIKEHLHSGDLMAVAGYEMNGVIAAHRFAVWSGTISHDKLVDESGSPLTVVVGKIRGDRIGMPRNSILDPAGAKMDVLDFSMFVNDRTDRQIWNIRLTGKQYIDRTLGIEPYHGAAVLGKEANPQGNARRLLGENILTIPLPMRASA